MYEISPAKITECDVAALLGKHFELMRAQSPPESCHVLPGDALASLDIHLFALRENGVALAVGAIRDFDSWGEIKSMHTANVARGRGFARALVTALITEAGRLGFACLKLETGSGPEHAAARGLYQSMGFAPCPPFGSYHEDPLSLFMHRDI